MPNPFLPVSMDEVREQGLEQLDFIMVTGDAYVDEKSFAHAVISRYLVAHGYSVGIIAQPDWRSAEAFKVLGEPHLAFLVSAGNMDSMVNIYTSAKKRRAKDMYSPGGKAGRRPERATAAYCKKLREAYGDVPIVIGGLEASLRRFAHYDYWADGVKPSILVESGADILVYGMGEKPVVEIAEALSGGLAAGDITYVEGTCYRTGSLGRVYGYGELPSFEAVRSNKKLYGDAFAAQYGANGTLVQKHGDGFVVQNPPAPPLSRDELDFVYSLPYAGEAHPMYKQGVPALDEVKFGITAVRGCAGGCSFCAIYYHQGKEVRWRSRESIVSEAKKLTERGGFKGYIHDVGGPTANLYGAACANPGGPCGRRSCLSPKICPHLTEGHSAFLDVLSEIRALDRVKKVFVRSGIRHDFALIDKSGRFIEELAEHYVSGELKLAPEHVCPGVLARMGKPKIGAYEAFVKQFNAASKRHGKKQYVLPYFMSSHPGCTLSDAAALAEYLMGSGFTPETAQDFYPTPGTLSTCIYHTGHDPFTGRKIYTPTSPEEKAMQRALIHYKAPQNRDIVKKALTLAKRSDLIGRGKGKLI